MPFCCINEHVNPAGRIWCAEADCDSLVMGAQIGDYVVTSYIQHGSTSSVYLAYQSSLKNRKVVMKVLRVVGSQSNLEHFKQEAELLASLEHPNILPIYTYGIIGEPRDKATPGSPYLVLPYAGQGSLEEVFEQEGGRPWPLDRVLPVIEQATEALEYAHGRGVLHRDVKPANLLLIGSRVVLSDFGVASLIGTDISHLDAPWAGSPAYMAPEVWQFRPGRYSDQYALAVTCFRLLTGAYPWQTSGCMSAYRWSHLHTYVEPRSLYDERPDLPTALSPVLQRALTKDPHRRYPSVKDFAADLKAAAYDITAVESAPAARRILRATPVQPSIAQQRFEPAPAFLPPAAPAQSVQIARPAVMTSAHPLVLGAQGDGGRKPAYDLNASTTQAPSSDELEVDGETDLLPGDSHEGTWVWRTFLLNLSICLLLALVAAWSYGGIMAATGLVLAIWPALLIGPFVGNLFQHVAHSSSWQGLRCGLLVGAVNTLLSALACYGWTTLWHTLPYQGNAWTSVGDGLRLFIAEAAKLAPTALTLLLPCALFSLCGGALMGLLSGPRTISERGLSPSVDTIGASPR
jgi:serine/threonine protein kinase